MFHAYTHSLNLAYCRQEMAIGKYNIHLKWKLRKLTRNTFVYGGVRKFPHSQPDTPAQCCQLYSDFPGTERSVGRFFNWLNIY